MIDQLKKFYTFSLVLVFLAVGTVKAFGDTSFQVSEQTVQFGDQSCPLLHMYQCEDNLQKLYEQELLTLLTKVVLAIDETIKTQPLEEQLKPYPHYVAEAISAYATTSITYNVAKGVALEVTKNLGDKSSEEAALHLARESSLAQAVVPFFNMTKDLFAPLKGQVSAEIWQKNWDNQFNLMKDSVFSKSLEKVESSLTSELSKKEIGELAYKIAERETLIYLVMHAPLVFPSFYYTIANSVKGTALPKGPGPSSLFANQHRQRAFAQPFMQALQLAIDGLK